MIYWYFGSLILYRNWFQLQACLRMSPFKWDIFQPSKMFIAREIMNKFLKSDTQYCLAHNSALWYRTEKFLYFRRSYGSHFSNELFSSLLALLVPEKLSKNCGSFFLHRRPVLFFSLYQYFLRTNSIEYLNFLGTIITGYLCSCTKLFRCKMSGVPILSQYWNNRAL